MDSFVGCILTVLTAIVVSISGLLIVRRKIPSSVLKQHHEVGSLYLNLVGLLYCVPLAFVIFLVWTELQDAKITIDNEANSLEVLLRLSEGLDEQKKKQIQTTVVDYANLVVTSEWETMLNGKASTKTGEALDRLWQIYISMNPSTELESNIQNESLTALEELTNSRRNRIRQSGDPVPILIWIVLYGGGLLVIVFTYFFSTELRSQILMTTALAAIIGVLLFLILALDNPYKGIISVDYVPFQRLIE